MCDVTGSSDCGTWRSLGSYKEEEDKEDRNHSADGDAPCDLPVGHGERMPEDGHSRAGLVWNG